MEILVTIIAFWLILVGAYGAYSLTRERSRERTPKVRPAPQVNLAAAPAGAGPFGPVSLPAERVPSFIARASAVASRGDAVEDFDEELARGEIDSDRFAAERIVAERLQARARQEETPLPEDEPVYEVPKPSMPRYAEPDEITTHPTARLQHFELPDEEPPMRREPPRRSSTRHGQPHVASFELPARPRPTEVDYLRAEVQHLRSEINALSYDQPAAPAGRQDRPKQRRYRTGNYTQLPRVLRRQVKEARGKFGGE